MSGMDYTVEKDGNTDVIDDKHVMNELTQMGYKVGGVSSDGQLLTLHDEKDQPYQVKIPDALKTMGFTVHKAIPTQSDQETIEPMLTGLVSTLPEDDDMRKSFIEAKLRRRGIDNPQVTGGGSEWHVFNPNTNQWAQLTEEPGMNKSGLAAGALALPHLIGMGLGGAAGLAAGAPGGPLALGSAALGAGVGSAAAQGLEHGALATFDPAYREALSGHGKDLAWDIAKTAGTDALAEGIAAPLIKGLPIKRIAGVAGDALKGGGELIGGLAGKLAKSDTASNLVGSMVAPQTDLLAFMAQAPREAVKFGAKLPGRLAESEVTGPLFSEESRQGLSNLSGRLLQGGGDSAEGILSNLSRSRGATARYAREGYGAEEAQAAKAARDLGAHYGIEGDAASALEKGSAQDFREGMIRQFMRTMPQKSSGVGRTIENLGAAGKGVSDLLTGGGRMLLRGAQGAGQAMKGTGSLVKGVGTGAQYFGTPTAAEYGALPIAKKWWEDENKIPMIP